MSKLFTDEEIDKIQAIIDSIPDYFDDVEEIQCPHCGEVQHSFESSEPGWYTEEAIIHNCENADCEKVFTIYGSMSWSWSTEANSDGGKPQ